MAHDERCKILISSLQDTLHGVETKSYNSGDRSRRSRSRDRDTRAHHRAPRRRERSASRYRDRSRDREDRDRWVGLYLLKARLDDWVSSQANCVCWLEVPRARHVQSVQFSLHNTLDLHKFTCGKA